MSSATGQANTDCGDVIRFGRVALTTGARPRRLDAPGSGLGRVTHLRSIQDAAALVEGLPARPIRRHDR